MLVIHIVDSLDPAAGGPPMVAARLAAAQAGLGHDVRLASIAKPAAAEAIRQSLERVPNIGRVLRADLPSPAGAIDRVTARSFGLAVEEYIRAYRGTCEADSSHVGGQILHLHGVWDPPLRAAAAVARRLRLPYVVAPHGMLDPWSLGQSRLKKRLALALGYRKMLDAAAFLHTLNADEKDLIAPLNLRCPIEVIPNGIFLEEFASLPATGGFALTCPAVAGQRYILFLSRLHMKKGLDYLADAFAILAPRLLDVHLVLAGPDEGARDDFEKRIATAGVQARVHVVGPLYGTDKLAALADAACFCLPSRQEGFSMAITEAMACGVPVVVSEACHFPEVQSAGAGEVTKLDARAVAEALERVLADNAKRKAMGEAGRQLVQARYTWPAIAERSVEAYRRHGA